MIRGNTVSKTKYGIYIKDRNQDVLLQNGELHENEEIYKLKYGWLPSEIMLESIENLEDKESGIYLLYSRHGDKPNEITRPLGERNMTYTELKEVLTLVNINL